jgi:hypothetical protein
VAVVAARQEAVTEEAAVTDLQMVVEVVMQTVLAEAEVDLVALPLVRVRWVLSAVAQVE